MLPRAMYIVISRDERRDPIRDLRGYSGDIQGLLRRFFGI